VLTVVGSAVLGIWMFLEMMGLPAEQRTIEQTAYQWVFAGGLSVDMAFQLDQLSMVFVLLITIVGSLIHVYSLGYMEHDPDRRKFFGFLNLFVAAMLLLVLANNYLLLYVGWRASAWPATLLIGFWQVKPSAAAAGEEGLHHQPGRRCRTWHRDHGHLRHLRLGRLRRGLRVGGPGQEGP
jgi:NADH-quinone oxidoreductase subunit L